MTGLDIIDITHLETKRYLKEFYFFFGWTKFYKIINLINVQC